MRLSNIYSTLFLTLVLSPFQSCSSTSDDENMEEPVAEDGGEAKAQESPKPKEEANDTSAAAAAETPVASPEPKAAPPTTEKPASATAGAAAVATGNIVYYIQAKSAPVYDQSGGKGKKVGSASRGDHFLITSVENGWAKTDDGRFIEAKNLSDKPLGRKKKGAVWK